MYIKMTWLQAMWESTIKDTPQIRLLSERTKTVLYRGVLLYVTDYWKKLSLKVFQTASRNCVNFSTTVYFKPSATIQECPLSNLHHFTQYFLRLPFFAALNVWKNVFYVQTRTENTSILKRDCLQKTNTSVSILVHWSCLMNHASCSFLCFFLPLQSLYTQWRKLILTEN